MAIDRSGRWWIGEDIADVEGYLREYTADGYPAEEISQCTCGTCGGRVLGLHGDVDEGSTRRTCRSCGAKHFIADSAETWPQSSPRTSTCVCGSKDFNLAVAYSLRESGDVQWVTVGQRCTTCGVLGSFVD